MDGMSDGDDLKRRLDELETAMRELQAELEGETNTPPSGVIRPPSVGDLLRFADQAAIPALIAILEANIRILESVRQAIRLTESTRRSETQPSQRSELAEVGEETLSRLAQSLDDLQTLIEAGSLPQEETARSILTDARDIQEELETQAETTDGTTEESSEEEVHIDIDAELESIKEEYDEDEPPSEEDS